MSFDEKNPGINIPGSPGLSSRIELDQTFASNLALRYYGIRKDKIFDQKATKLRIEAEFRQAFFCGLF